MANTYTHLYVAKYTKLSGAVIFVRMYCISEYTFVLKISLSFMTSRL